MDEATEKLGEELKARITKAFGRSLSIREVDAGSCNGCEVEVNALTNAVHDVERFGLHIVASPRHADMLVEVTGRLGLADQEAIERWSKDLDACREAGLDVGRVHVAEDAPMGMFKGALRTPRAMLARQMWSRDRRYQVTAEVKVGLINTYDLVETLAVHLLASYPGRASIFERSPVDLIRLSEEEATLRSNGHVITADSVVMCTNGYRMPRTESCSPPLIGGKVEGKVGYMTMERQPVASMKLVLPFW